MRTVWKSVFGLWMIGLCVAGSASAQAASGVGPYYATPAWDQTLPGATRFLVLTNMNSDAVLDRETGLVWDKVPSLSSFTWFNASDHCVRLNKGGRKAWRLPTIQDLASLIDPTQVDPGLPSGHPFTVTTDAYWSASTVASITTLAWLVGVFDGSVATFGKSNSARAWCVRGGPGVDPQ